jgi:hypothetical protein
VRLECAGNLEQHAVTRGVTARIVDRFQTVDVDESQDEWLRRALRAGHVTTELDDSRAPHVHAGQPVDRGVLAFLRGRAAVSKRDATIGLGVVARTRASTAVGKCGAPVEAGLTAFTCASATVGQRSGPVNLGLAALTGARTTILPGPVSVVRSVASGGRGSVDILDRRLGTRMFGAFGNVVPCVGRAVTLVGEFVALIADLVALVGSSVTVRSRLVAPARGPVPVIRSAVAPLGLVVAPLARLVPLLGVAVTTLTSLVAKVRRFFASRSQHVIGARILHEAPALCIIGGSRGRHPRVAYRTAA